MSCCKEECGENESIPPDHFKIDDFPDLVMTTILSHLDVDDISRCFCISRAWAARSRVPEIHERVIGHKPMIIARRIGDDVLLDSLESGGVNNYKLEIDDLYCNVEGVSPLNYASYNGYTIIIEALIMAGANINEKDEQGKTPLHRASQCHHDDVVEILVANGADINAADHEGWSPIFEAAFYGSEEVARALIHSGADVNAVADDDSTPLLRDADSGHEDVVRVLIDAGADVNIALSNTGWTPLIVASAGGYVGALQELINAGADLNAKDDEGCTALHHAIRTRSTRPAKVLIDSGAHVNPTDQQGRTPIDLTEPTSWGEEIFYLRMMLQDAGGISGDYFKAL